MSTRSRVETRESRIPVGLMTLKLMAGTFHGSSGGAHITDVGASKLSDSTSRNGWLTKRPLLASATTVEPASVYVNDVAPVTVTVLVPLGKWLVFVLRKSSTSCPLA